MTTNNNNNRMLHDDLVRRRGIIRQRGTGYCYNFSCGCRVCWLDNYNEINNNNNNKMIRWNDEKVVTTTTTRDKRGIRCRQIQQQQQQEGLESLFLHLPLYYYYDQCTNDCNEQQQQQQQHIRQSIHYYLPQQHYAPYNNLQQQQENAPEEEDYDEQQQQQQYRSHGQQQQQQQVSMRRCHTMDPTRTSNDPKFRADDRRRTSTDGRKRRRSRSTSRSCHCRYRPVLVAFDFVRSVRGIWHRLLRTAFVIVLTSILCNCIDFSNIVSATDNIIRDLSSSSINQPIRRIIHDDNATQPISVSLSFSEKQQHHHAKHQQQPKLKVSQLHHRRIDETIIPMTTTKMGTETRSRLRKSIYDCSTYGCYIDGTISINVCGTDGNMYMNECLAYCQKVSLDPTYESCFDYSSIIETVSSVDHIDEHEHYHHHHERRIRIQQERNRNIQHQRRLYENYQLQHKHEQQHRGEDQQSEYNYHQQRTGFRRMQQQQKQQPPDAHDNGKEQDNSNRIIHVPIMERFREEGYRLVRKVQFTARKKPSYLNNNNNNNNDKQHRHSDRSLISSPSTRRDGGTNRKNNNNERIDDPPNGKQQQQQRQPASDSTPLRNNKQALLKSLGASIRITHDGFEYVSSSIDEDVVSSYLSSAANGHRRQQQQQQQQRNSYNDKPEPTNLQRNGKRTRSVRHRQVTTTNTNGNDNMEVFGGRRIQQGNNSTNTTDTNGSKLRSIIGDDRRSRVVSTLASPYNKMASLSYIGCDDCCSGSIIYTDSLLTAGHCLYEYDAQAWYDHTYVTPGRNGRAGDKYRNITEPYGRWNFSYATIFRSYYTHGNSEYDIAVINYKPNDMNVRIGNAVGWLALQSVEDYNDSNLQRSNITGYPGDKYAQQWTSGGGCNFNQLSPLFIASCIHQCDTNHGMSGSPIIGMDNKVRGIHTAGTTNEITAVYPPSSSSSSRSTLAPTASTLVIDGSNQPSSSILFTAKDEQEWNKGLVFIVGSIHYANIRVWAKITPRPPCPCAWWRILCRFSNGCYTTNFIPYFG